ncbi:hypothetical protein AMECASPLE_027440, partial [Ameca splendens]
ERQRANVSSLAKRHNSSTGSKGVIRSSIICTELSTNELLSVYLVDSFMNGVIKTQALLDFLSEIYRKQTVFQRIPCRDLVSMTPSGAVSRSEGGPHQRGNVQFWLANRTVATLRS